MKRYIIYQITEFQIDRLLDYSSFDFLQRGIIEDVIVSDQYRGKSLGKL